MRHCRVWELSRRTSFVGRFFQDTNNENLVDTITALKPHVVWVQGHGRGLDAMAHLCKTADVQFGEGGMFPEDRRLKKINRY